MKWFPTLNPQYDHNCHEQKATFESHKETCIDWTSSHELRFSIQSFFEQSAIKNHHSLCYWPSIHNLILKFCPKYHQVLSCHFSKVNKRDPAGRIIDFTIDFLGMFPDFPASVDFKNRLVCLKSTNFNGGRSIDGFARYLSIGCHCHHASEQNNWTSFTMTFIIYYSTSIEVLNWGARRRWGWYFRDVVQPPVFVTAALKRK